MSKLCIEHAGGEDWVQSLCGGRVSIMYACPWCRCAPMRMNGWVRAKASTQAAWFCPKCGDKWTQGAGSSR
eukprot:5048512-Amphidinium_carterae.1